MRVLPLLVAVLACCGRHGDPAATRDAAIATTATSAPMTNAWHGKSLHVWLTSCDLEGAEAKSLLAAIDRSPGVVTSVGFACQKLARDGSFSADSERPAGSGRRLLSSLFHARGVETSITIANYGVAGFDGEAAKDVVSNERARDALIESLVRARADEGHASIELDLEGMPSSAKGAFTTFVRLLAARAPGLVVDVHPKTVDDPGWDGPGADDYRAIADAGAIVRAMTYDLSIGPVPPGPSTKARWIADVVAYARSVGVPASRLEIGLPAYGYDFPPKNSLAAAPLKHRDVLALVAKVKPAIVRDADGTPHFSYDAADGKHEVWFDDAESLSRVLVDAAPIAKDVRGVGVWGVDGADPKLFAALAQEGL